MVFSPSLPPNHSKTTRILPDVGRRCRFARPAQDVRHRADAAEQAKPEAAGADPHHVATRDAAVGQSVLGSHGVRLSDGTSTRSNSRHVKRASRRHRPDIRRSVPCAAFGAYCEDCTEAATTECFCVPMPSIVHTAVSPARIQRGSARSMLVPAGLPPEIMSPGLSVRMFDAYAAARRCCDPCGSCSSPA